MTWGTFRLLGFVVRHAVGPSASLSWAWRRA